MSAQLGKLCSLLLLEYFGETVEKVGIDLFRGGQKNLRLICQNTKLSVNDVRQSLCILIKYGLVTFSASKIPRIAEYKLHSDKILLLLRYPKYLISMKSLYGNEAEIIVEEVLRHGRDVAPHILLRSYKRITEKTTDGVDELKLQRIRDIFEMLVNKQYLKRSPEVVEKQHVPKICRNESNEFRLPKIDMCSLYEALSKSKPYFENDVFWEINFDRFHQDMRDDLLVIAMIRRTNSKGGEIMRLFLQQMYFKSNPWISVSNPVLVSELKEICNKSNADINLISYLEGYLAVMTEDFGGFLRKSNTVSLAYEINMKNASIEFIWCLLSNTVDAKYGSNAARIFSCITSTGHSNTVKQYAQSEPIKTTRRIDFYSLSDRLKLYNYMDEKPKDLYNFVVVQFTLFIPLDSFKIIQNLLFFNNFWLIREQEFVEQDEIQKKAMLPDKEAKYLTYCLLQSGWIQQHELKKGFQKSGPTKTFYLFYIDFEQVVRMYVEICYKSLCNAITLREQEKMENKCLLEKKQRIDAIVLHMKNEGATDEQVAEIEEMVTPPEHVLLEKIHLNVNKVSQAELQIDETLFILQLYLSFKDI